MERPITVERRRHCWMFLVLCCVHPAICDRLMASDDYWAEPPQSPPSVTIHLSDQIDDSTIPLTEMPYDPFDPLTEIEDDCATGECFSERSESNRGVCYAPGRPEKPKRKMLGDRDRSGNPPYRYTISNHQRAGKPFCISCLAMPSITKRYSAWFVGGGAVIGGNECCEPEGTWGMDYHGLLKPRRVWLKWTGGRKQGGEGAYKTDGHTGPIHGH